MSERPRCEATCSTHGQRCRKPGWSVGLDGRRFCGTHAKAEPDDEPEADGDGVHVNAVNDLLIEAMNHELWAHVPGPIRHLIEHAWVELDRAVGDS